MTFTAKLKSTLVILAATTVPAFAQPDEASTSPFLRP
jgi:hypothetical protein